MISFSQTGEDILIERVFSGSTGFYIDVGAGDPVVDSVTKYFYLQGWRGINVEPNNSLFPEIQRDRPQDINLECAVGGSRGRVAFHQLPNSGLSTISPAFLAEFSPADHANTRHIVVEMRTLADICAEFVTGEIDFLKIDAEGAEGDVVAGADWQRFRPRLLVIESTRPWTSEPVCEAWEPTLLSVRYTLCACDGLNRYYLRNEDLALAGQLSMPVNVLDCYITADEVQLRQRITALEDEIRRLQSLLAGPRS
jgi:FkbM family methyltransferase